jgi:hypothetical protein
MAWTLFCADLFHRAPLGISVASSETNSSRERRKAQESVQAAPLLVTPLHRCLTAFRLLKL